VGETVERSNRSVSGASMKRSPNRIANWFIARFPSNANRADLAITLRSASHSSLIAA